MRSDVEKRVNSEPDAFGDSAPNGARLTYDIGSKRREQAAVRWIVAMAR